MEVRSGSFGRTITHRRLPRNELGLNEKTTLFELLINACAKPCDGPAEGLIHG